MEDPISMWFYILLVCLPSLIVFALCYLLIKQFLKNREQMELIEVRKQSDARTLPLRLQAYERLVLLFERMDVANLISRLRTKNMSSGDLQSSLMVTIQKEFEHNVTQQIYVSDKLWEILILTRQDLLNQLHQVMIETGFSEDVEDYSNALIEHFGKKGMNPVQKAIYAIKQEAKLHL